MIPEILEQIATKCPWACYSLNQFVLSGRFHGLFALDVLFWNVAEKIPSLKPVLVAFQRYLLETDFGPYLKKKFEVRDCSSVDRASSIAAGKLKVE